MPQRKRLARKATDADADAHSRMSLRLPSRQEDKALKLVSDSADTKAHAQWPKTGMERQRRILVGVICSQQMKISPLRDFIPEIYN